MIEWAVSNLGLMFMVALTAFVVIHLLRAEHMCSLGHSRFRVWIFKPLASLGFLFIAIAVGAFNSVFGSMIFVALVLGAIGDVLLIPHDNKKAFMAGMGAFMLGHLCYCASFLYIGVSGLNFMIGTLMMGLVISMVLPWLLPRVGGLMSVMLIAYILVISLMAALSFGAFFRPQAYIFMVAAVLFVVADIVTARNRFVKKQFINKLIYLPLYYTAQTLFAIGAGS